jgi:hypothetical protein
MKKYQPPEEHYDHCGDCTFCSGSGCFFCAHPFIINSLTTAERRIMCFDKNQPPLKVWMATPIPGWCPLEDVDE